jgi:hypothetical protein
MNVTGNIFSIIKEIAYKLIQTMLLETENGNLFEEFGHFLPRVRKLHDPLIVH